MDRWCRGVKNRAGFFGRCLSSILKVLTTQFLGRRIGGRPLAADILRARDGGLCGAMGAGRMCMLEHPLRADETMA